MRELARDRVGRLRAIGLRGLRYLQSPNGNVVLWMQPDGTLHPSADSAGDAGPVRQRRLVLARATVWALGEGYAAFRHEDPAFAGVLRGRLDLALGALQREVLSKYGRTQIVDGRRVPAWLIVDGADATAEAMLGLAAYVDAGGPPAARTALGQFAQGVAALGTPADSSWPYGALLPTRCRARSGTHGRPRCPRRSRSRQPRCTALTCCRPRSPTPPRSRRTC